MKSLKMISLAIGNIGIRLSLQGFSHIGDKTGATTHSHGVFEYHFAMKGNATIRLDDKKILIPESSAILIFPDTFHNFVNGEEKAEVLSLSFSLRKNKSGTDYFKTIEPVLAKNGYLVISESNGLKELVFSIISTIYSEKIFAAEEIRSHLTLLFTNILSRMVAGENEDNRQFSAQEFDTRTYIIEDYFNEHYMENITLSELAEHLHLGTQQTDRMIKRIYNVGFRQRLTKIRIKSAMELLADTSKSITDISVEVGYESYSGFYSSFKKTVAKTPQEWRKEHQKSGL